MSCLKATPEVLKISGKQPREYYRCLESLGHRFVQRLVLVTHRTLGGGRRGAIIRPISAVPPKFMSVIRAHSSKLPVNRPFSMKRLLFVILRCFDWSSPWRRNTGFWARPTARGARAEQAPWGILGDSIAVVSWETTTQTPWRSFTSKDGPQPPAQH